jgi:nucleoside-diphosphate-sugar epimerase
VCDHETVKVAVLGASGFVGGHLLRWLRGEGVDTRAVVRNRAFAARDRDARIADACDVYALRDAFDGCDAVVHAALGTTDEIVESVAPVYAAAQAVGVRRLVYISSGSVHGQSPAIGTYESSPLHVRHPFSYNNAKVRAERRLRTLRARGTVEVVVLRPTIVFGPGSRWVFDFADALRANRAYLIDDARGICNSIYVDNLAYAVRLALTVPNIDGEVFLVSDRETVTWRDLFRPIAFALGGSIDEVPSVSPPEVKPGLKALYIEPVRTSALGRAIVATLPVGVKSAVKGMVRTLRRRRPPRDPGEEQIASSSARVDVSPEFAALQRCRWRLPNDKAIARLGYDPPVSFAEGCRRSIDWLLFHRAPTG